MNYDKPLTESELQNLREMVSRRGKREPLQQIIGKVYFYNSEILVNKNVIVPRQETELLVETAIFEIKKRNEPVNILDIVPVRAV